jgi:biopolymer transport protein ExbD
MKIAPPEHPSPNITLSPLIDVMFILLIFVILTARFEAEGQLEVDLPEARAEPAPERQAVVVELDAEGRVAVDGEPVEPERLAEVLAVRAADHDELVLLADRDARVQAAVDILTQARAVGFEAVGVGTQLPEE